MSNLLPDLVLHSLSHPRLPLDQQRQQRRASMRVITHCVLIGLLLTIGCTTKPVPGVCCIGAEDCRQLGLNEDRLCPEGQACVDFQCVLPSCSTMGCSMDAPVCDIATDVCTACRDSADCSRFGDADVCNTQTGTCVECLAATDCATAEPVCDRGSCRTCRSDSECTSGACGEDGSCLPEDVIVYLNPSGTDAGACTRAEPCREPQFGIGRTNATRNHIVMAPGSYRPGILPVYINAETTSAWAISIHGGGARLTHEGSEVMFMLKTPVLIRDLEIDYPLGSAIAASQAVLERVRIRSRYALTANGSVTVRDAFIEGPGLAGYSGYAVYVNIGVLVIDRAVLARNSHGIVAWHGSSVSISNVLVHGTTDVALDLQRATGSVTFSTIADSGINSSGASGIVCPDSPGALTVHSSIIWTPGAHPATFGACGFTSTIAGPIGAAGALNVDPKFVNPGARDYHLGMGSPARDMVDTGPAADFERDSRPKGPRFDIGADEAE